MRQFTIILSILVPIVFGDCRDGWVEHNSTCYFFSMYNNDNWSSSEFDCQMLGGYLAEIETMEENAFLEDYLMKIYESDPKKNGTFFWLGGSDMESDGKFVWMKSRHPFLFTDWIPGEPNNFHGHEDCIAFGGYGNFKWNDMPCGAPVHYICEMPMVQQPLVIG